MRASAAEYGLDSNTMTTNWMTKLRADGLNLFHIAVSNDLGWWLNLATAQDFSIIAQLDSAYLTSTSPTVVQQMVNTATSLVTPYQSHAKLVAISVREEPPLSLMDALDLYYGGLRTNLPNVRLFLLNNTKPPANYVLTNKPDLLGSDRYAFWGWDASAGGYAATPASALGWLLSELTFYSENARSLGKPYTSVLTFNKGPMFISAAQVASGSYGDAARISNLVAQGSQGWALLSDGRYRFWKYYRPPENTIKAQVWLSVLANAKNVIVWSGDVADPALENLIAEGTYVADGSSTAHEISLLTRSERFLPSTGNLTTDYDCYTEFVSSVGDVRQYGNIVQLMQPNSVNNGWVTVANASLKQRNFTLSGVTGKIVLTVNLDVGTWASSSVPYLWGRTDYFPISAQGDLVGYTPKSTTQSITVTAGAGERVYDLATGNAVDTAGTASLAIAAGGARMVFVGTPSEAVKALALR